MNRLTQLTFKNGKKARNRVVVPPMASQTADEAGFATDKTIEHYKRLSESGAGIVFVEYSYIHQSGKSEPHQLGVAEDEHIEGLRKIAQTIKSSGALAGIQLVHAGGKTDSKLTGHSLLGPSALAVPVKDRELEVPQAATISDIENIISWYHASTKRAAQAGFDIIELHAAHGYGLGQWLSPLTNQRRDEFGGGIVGRSFLLRKVTTILREEFKAGLLAVRLPAEDHLPGGLEIDEMAWVTKELERIGINLVDVSSGLGGWRRPRGSSGQGYLVSDASLLKKATNLPVIGVGGIKEGSFIDEVIEKRSIDLAAVGRAILADPVEWRGKHLV